MILVPPNYFYVVCQHSPQHKFDVECVVVKSLCKTSQSYSGGCYTWLGFGVLVTKNRSVFNMHSKLLNIIEQQVKHQVCLNKIEQNTYLELMK